MKYLLTVFLIFAVHANAEKVPGKIVSLAPSITEILCALELQERIVGVTDFCKDPYKKSDFKGMSIGGIINPNIEKMLKSQPDVVLILKGKSEHASKLKKLGMNILELDHKNLDGVFHSIKKIGEVCQVKAKSDKLLKELSRHLKDSDNSEGKRVLITISRLSSQSNIRLWVAGNDGFYSRLLKICGAKNAYQENAMFQQVSLEYLVRLDPDVIILIRDKMSEKEQAQEKKFWRQKLSIRAVKNDNFHIVTGDEIMIPGPRFPMVLEKFKKVLDSNE